MTRTAVGGIHQSLKTAAAASMTYWWTAIIERHCMGPSPPSSRQHHYALHLLVPSVCCLSVRLSRACR